MMTELHVLAVSLFLMSVAFVVTLRLLHVSWMKLAVAVGCVVILAIGAFLQIENAVVALLLACIPIVSACMLLPDEAELKRLWWRVTKSRRALTTPEFIGDASIISSLEEKMDRVLANGGHAVIMGGDGYPVGDTKYPWREYIEKLLDRGCKLTQYVIALTAEAQKAFDELQTYAEKGRGEFRYRQLANPSEVVDENDRHLIGMLATYHPTLAWNDKGERMLWLESRHPAKSTVAFGCKYYSPECLEAERKPFDDKMDLLDRAWIATEGVTSPT